MRRKGSRKKQKLLFLRNGKSFTGLAILGFFAVLAVIGPWIAPYDPSAMSSDILQPRAVRTGSAPRTWARTCSPRSSWARAAS